MAITWIDGFDLYSNARNPGNTRYSTSNPGTPGTPALTTGRFGSGQALKFDANNGNTTSFGPFPAATNTVAVGFAFKAQGGSLAATGTRRIMGFRDSSNNIIASLQITSGGILKFTRGDNSADLIAAPGGTIVADAWNYIELQFTRNASTGSAELFMNGVSLGTVSGANTGSASIDNFIFCNPQSLNATTAELHYDDLYVKNDTTVLGEVRVEVLTPTADTADSDWTPSSGSDNFAMVDEATYDDDTTYNAASVAGDLDMFTMGNLSNTPVAIHAVQTIYAARKDDATPRTIRSVLDSGGTIANGVTRGLGTTYGVFVDIYLLDPDTTAAWDAAGVNAITAGVEVVT